MKEKWTLLDRVILVTGGSQGIGEAITAALAGQGAIVWIGELPAKRDQAESVAKKFGAKVHCVDLDVNSDESVTAAVATVLKDGQPIYGLVNNAGIVGVGGFMAPLSQFREQFETNTLGSLRVAQAVIPGMRKAKEGVIIQIASLGALLVPHERAAYTISKHGALAIPKIIAEEFALEGIRALAICPNRVSVPAAVERANRSEADYANMMGTQASGAMIDSDEIAYIVQSALMPGMKRWNGDVITVSDGATCSLRQATFPPGSEPAMPK